MSKQIKDLQEENYELKSASRWTTGEDNSIQLASLHQQLVNKTD
jgi:hypothetical protein